jgi:membrane-associated phospholipid phosphatase
VVAAVAGSALVVARCHGVRAGLRPALAWLVGLGAGAVVELTTKAMLDRPRPPGGPGGLARATLELGGAFPSGHAVHAAMLATVAWRLWPGPGVAAAGAAWIVLVPASRVVMGAHWPSDVVGGALLGLAVAALLPLPSRGPLSARGPGRAGRGVR